jgi:hypothetical protein
VPTTGIVAVAFSVISAAVGGLGLPKWVWLIVLALGIGLLGVAAWVQFRCKPVRHAPSRPQRTSIPLAPLPMTTKSSEIELAVRERQGKQRRDRAIRKYLEDDNRREAHDQLLIEQARREDD